MPRIQVTCDCCGDTQEVDSVGLHGICLPVCSWCNEDVCDGCGEGLPLMHADCFDEEQAYLYNDQHEYSGN